MLVGHGLAYIVAGHNQADGHHSYVAPALGYSAALLLAFCAVRLFRALSRGRILAATGYSLLATTAKLSVVQISLFALAERLEGYTPAPLAYVIQILVALCAAVAIAYFAQLVHRCERSAIEAHEYLRRIRTFVAVPRFARLAHSPAYALAISAGAARFQRPPPQR
jgi:hypothetical protein